MAKASIFVYEGYDFLGIILSSLCGVHCLLTPLAILYLPAFGGYLESVWVHAILIGFVAFSFHQSIYTHYNHHRSILILGTGLVGFGILLMSTIVEVFLHAHETGHAHHGEDHYEPNLLLVLTVFGAILLIVSHILNIRKCRCLLGQGKCLEN